MLLNAADLNGVGTVPQECGFIRTELSVGTGFYFLNSFFARSRSLQAQLIVRRASRAFPVRIWS